MLSMFRVDRGTTRHIGTQQDLIPLVNGKRDKYCVELEPTQGSVDDSLPMKIM